MASSEHKFVFVGGLQRSGTTMLYRYLDEHPQVSALSNTARDTNEGQHNQTVYPGDEWHGKGGRFAFRPEARFTEDSPLVTPGTRRSCTRSGAASGTSRSRTCSRSRRRT